MSVQILIIIVGAIVIFVILACAKWHKRHMEVRMDTLENFLNKTRPRTKEAKLLRKIAKGLIRNFCRIEPDNFEELFKETFRISYEYGRYRYKLFEYIGDEFLERAQIGKALYFYRKARSEKADVLEKILPEKWLEEHEDDVKEVA
jgi:hypothetical protein